MRHTRILPRTILFATIMATLTAGSAAWAQPAQPWTTVGSAGTVDEADLLKVHLGTPVPGAVAMRPDAFGIRGAFVHIRYNVVALPGILGNTGLTLTSRFLDRGAGDRVFIEFKQYGLSTGLTTTLLTLDSNMFPGSPVFQVQGVFTPRGARCAPLTPPLDFTNNSYFMDVTISRSFFDLPPLDPPIAIFAVPEPANVVGPVLGMIMLDGSTCIE